MIKIIDDYYVRADNFQFTALQGKNGKTKDGEDCITYRTLGYYTTLTGAIQGIRQFDTIEALSDGEWELDEAIDKIEEITNKFQKVLERHINL